MSINLVTYANQTVTPTNDAIIYERAIDQNGIFYGCNVTVTSNTVNITGGYGIVCGREFVINSESLTVTLAPSGTLQGRLYVRLDLADADAPIQLLTATGNTLPALVQDDDVNYTNGTYEMELATFTVGVSSLSDVVETYQTIVGAKADFIVEQGTDGIWTYRKWNSGIAECWTYIEGNTASDGGWSINPTLPSFFNSTQVIVNVNYWSSGYTTTSAGYTRTNISGSTWSIDAYMYNGAPNALAGAYVSAKGTWK